MRRWLRDHRRALRDAVARFSAGPFASLLNIVVIGVALSLPAALYLALTQLQTFTRQLSSEPQVSIFLGLDAGIGDVEYIEKQLRTDNEVGTWRYVPRERAFAELKRSAGLSEVLENLKQNPLPDAFVATARDGRAETLERLRESAAAWPKVEHVQVDSDWARRLYAALRVGRTAAGILGGLLSIALVAVTFNTIRLQILTRREEIEVSKLIGATNPFIRRPFLYFGATQGFVGGLAACAIVQIASALLNRDIAALAELYSMNFRLIGINLADGASLLLFSALLGWLGAYLSVTRHLWSLDSR